MYATRGRRLPDRDVTTLVRCLAWHQIYVYTCIEYYLKSGELSFICESFDEYESNFVLVKIPKENLMNFPTIFNIK